jgi:hypothetical protein
MDSSNVKWLIKVPKWLITKKAINYKPSKIADFKLMERAVPDRGPMYIFEDGDWNKKKKVADAIKGSDPVYKYFPPTPEIPAQEAEYELGETDVWFDARVSDIKGKKKKYILDGDIKRYIPDDATYYNPE